MQCPKCNYLMTDFDTECPRCAKAPAQPASTPPQSTSQNVVAAPVPEQAKKWQQGCCFGCLTILVLTILLPALIIGLHKPQWMPAAGHMTIGTTLYYANHNEHGVIINKRYASPSSPTDGSDVGDKIQVKMAEGDIQWEDAEISGRVFLVKK